MPIKANRKYIKEIYGPVCRTPCPVYMVVLWVGPQSTNANTDGYRNVLQASRLKVPVLVAWGCFADEYHWTDGIGPRDKHAQDAKKPTTRAERNDNSFSTHEFPWIFAS